MELTKQQSLILYLNKAKSISYSKKYKFSTKYKWRCLSCMKTIYVNYFSCSRQSIYCKECYSLVQTKPTIIQYQYIRKLKEEQMNFVDNNIQFDINQ